MGDPEEIVISVQHVSKTFKLPHERSNTLKASLIHFWGHKKGYEEQDALKNVSFDIKKGEFFGIVGRNGSGKSTLLKVIAGIYAPTRGVVHINGKLTPFIELGVGFNMELTGRDNVFLNGALLGFSRKEVGAMYKDIVEFAELERFMDQKLKNYSSGMQVRLAFSIAIKAEADILLIDEVLAVGDKNFQEKCFAYFNKLKRSDKTVVFVTHDMASVERFCSRVLVIDNDIPNPEVVDVPTAIVTYNRLNYKPIESKGITNVTNNSKISLKKVEFINEKGKMTQFFEHNEKLTARLYLSSNLKQKEKIVIGLAFYDSDGVNIAGPNSKSLDLTSDMKVVEYQINKIPFTSGEYNLTVGIFDGDNTKQYDFLDKAGSFFVNSTKPVYGKVSLDDSWQAQNNQGQNA